MIVGRHRLNARSHSTAGRSSLSTLRRLRLLRDDCKGQKHRREQSGENDRKFFHWGSPKEIFQNQKANINRQKVGTLSFFRKSGVAFYFPLLPFDICLLPFDLLNDGFPLPRLA
jgi:hypothetical protein